MSLLFNEFDSMSFIWMSFISFIRSSFHFMFRVTSLILQITNFQCILYDENKIFFLHFFIFYLVINTIACWETQLDTNHRFPLHMMIIMRFKHDVFVDGRKRMLLPHLKLCSCIAWHCFRVVHIGVAIDSIWSFHEHHRKKRRFRCFKCKHNNTNEP